MQLNVEPVWNWPIVAAIGAAMLAFVLLTYPPRIRHLSRPWRATLLGLRLLATLTLIFAMLRPSIEISEPDNDRSQFLLLLDRSRSMATPDEAGGLTRRQALQKLLTDNQTALTELSEEVDIKLFDFAQEIEPIETAENRADGDLTAIGHALNELRDSQQSGRTLGVILFSDGAQRAGAEQDIDPLTAARRLAEQQGVPIHTVTFGLSELTASGLDLSVEDLVLDQPVTFERKTVPVRLQVRMLGAAGHEARVRLLMEDRTGLTLGETGPLKEIPLSGDAQPFKTISTRENSTVIPVELSFVAERPGDYKIAAEVVPQDGEIKVTNNRLETLITVRKGGLRVAYFDIPRPEQRFIRNLNRTAKIQLDMQVVLSGELGIQTRIDPKLFEPDQYDVYLIGDIPASVFQQGNDRLLERLAERVREGAGLGMIGGLHNFGPGGYASTPLNRLLPVKMSPSDQRGPTEDTAPFQLQHPVKMLPTAAGGRHYLMRLAVTSDASADAWRRLPDLGGASRLEPKSGATEILAESASEEPLLLVSDTGTGRVLALAVDETWKWHLRGYDTEHQRFWQQIVLWLARKEFDSDQPVWARVEPRNFPPLSRVPIEFGAQDENGTPIPEANFQVEVIPPDGEAESVPAQRANGTGTADFSQTMEPGDYWVKVTGTSNGELLGPTAMTRFVIDGRDPEMDNPAADPGLMSEIAAMSGGTVVPEEDFGSFLKTLLEEGVPAELMRYRRYSLWDNWPLLLLFVVLMCVEWTLRKLKGMV